MPAGLSKGDENPLNKDTGIFLYAPLRKVMSLVSAPRDSNSKKAAEKCCTAHKNKKNMVKIHFQMAVWVDCV